MLNVYESVAANKRKSWLVMIFFTLFVAAVAWIFGEALGYGPAYVGTALIFAGLMSFVSYWFSDKIILTISRARPAIRSNILIFIQSRKISVWQRDYPNQNFMWLKIRL